MKSFPVDFNSLTWLDGGRVFVGEGRVFGVEHGLTEGERVKLRDDDLEAEGNIEWDERYQVWWAVPDPETYQDIPYP